MRWYGGYSGRGRAPIVPSGAAPLWPTVADVWRVGHWMPRDVMTASHSGRHVALVGTFGATAHDVSEAARSGLPDDATWRWPGAFAAVENAGTRLTLLTDPCATSPVYAVGLDEGLMWASSARALAALTGDLVDTDRLFEEVYPGTGDETGDDRTFFVGVRQIPPGSKVTMTGGRMKISRAWSIQTVDGNPTTRLRHAITEAVRARSGGDLTCDLSGGADSSALTVTAARLNARGVTAFTLYPAGVRAGGDLDYARAVARSSSRIRHRLLPLTAEHLPYAGLDALPATDEPAPSTIANAQLRHQMSLVAAWGSEAHLTGDGGDSVFRTPDEHLADLAQRFRLKRMVSEATALGRLRGVAPWTLVAAACRPGRRGQSRSVHLPPGETDFATRAVMAEVRETARTARADTQIAEHLGVNLHNPLLDPAVVHAVLATGIGWRPGRHAYKPHLYAAMRPWLPASVSNRMTKGSFHADYYRGLRRHLAAIADLLSGCLLDLGLVDHAQIDQELRRAAAGLGTDRIDRAIRVEAWLRAVRRSEPVIWHRVDKHLAAAR